MIVKKSIPGFSSLSGRKIIFPALLAVFMALPQINFAQQRYTGVEVKLSGGGLVYQGGRKSQRGIRVTTSGISLPDLNAILSSSTTTKAKATTQKNTQTTAVAANQVTASTDQGRPRFGYGSGPVQPPQADPLVPIDPGYDDVQPANPAPTDKGSSRNVTPQPGVIIQEPGLQIEHSTVIPFVHGYYPRTYVPRVPYICSPFDFHHQLHHHHGCRSRTFSTHSLFGGSLFSSRRYSSSCGIPRVSFRLSF